MNANSEHYPEIVKSVDNWLQRCVLGLSLCPYARVPYQRGEVRIVVVASNQLSQGIDHEIQFLQQEPAQAETTLLVIADSFEDFLDFNDLVGDIEDMLQDHKLDTQFQLASFHPVFLFGGEAADDASHYTNRAPYPIVQLLRVESVAQAVEEGDTLAVPERNIETLRGLDPAQLQALFPWVG